MSDPDRIPVLPEPEHILEARRRWQFNGSSRPDFAETPGPEQISVWDFPRPPAILPCAQLLTVRTGDTLIAETRRGVRVLETAGAPTYYFPPEDVVAELSFGDMSSVCEWKGVARYFAPADGGAEPVAFAYNDPTPAFEAIAGWISFYPGRVECFLDDERVRPQPGGFYAGWITDDIIGPVKGEPGTGHW